MIDPYEGSDMVVEYRQRCVAILQCIIGHFKEGGDGDGTGDGR